MQGKDYFQKNKKKKYDYRALRKKTIPIIKARITICDLISKSFKKKGWKKSSNTYEILGCDYEFFKHHIESQFSEGMNWQTHGQGNGKWNYDHIIPIAITKTKDDVVKLCHWSNFQPLWSIDNLRKGSKIGIIR